MNDLPEKVWLALLELQQACADAAMPLMSVTMVGAIGSTKYSTTIGTFEVVPPLVAPVELAKGTP